MEVKLRQAQISCSYLGELGELRAVVAVARQGRWRQRRPEKAANDVGGGLVFGYLDFNVKEKRGNGYENKFVDY